MMIARVLNSAHPTEIKCALRDLEPCDGLSTQICFCPRFLGGCGHDVDKPVATQPTLRRCQIAYCLLPRGELVHLPLGMPTIFNHWLCIRLSRRRSPKLKPKNLLTGTAQDLHPLPRRSTNACSSVGGVCRCATPLQRLGRRLSARVVRGTLP